MRFPRSAGVPLTDITEFWLHTQLWLYVPPIILIIGTIGNILSFIILTRKRMTGSTYSYLAVLAIADTIYLYSALFRRWIRTLTGYDVLQVSNWSCKGITMLMYTASHYSVWLIIAVTMERYIAVRWPLKAKTLCTKRRAIIVIISLLIGIIGINSHIAWTFQVLPTANNSTFCAGERVIWPWVDACLYSFLPLLLITVLNGLIIQKVVAARKYRQHMSGQGQDRRQTQVDGGVKLTIMLLTISFTFLVTTVPINIVLIIVAVFLPKDLTAQQYAKYTLLQTVVALLMYTNHSINFFLYCVTGQKFKQQLRRLFCGKANGDAPTSSNTQTTATSAV